jgi:phosphoglycolate phosphatase-like HAD superfamily hydrolase
MRHKPQALLFDLDGTLLDATDLGNGLNHVLTAHNQPVCDYAAYRNVTSDGSMVLLDIGFGLQVQHDKVDELHQQFLDDYHQTISVDT